MKTLLFWCLIALLAGLPMYFLYWSVFRAALIQRLKYKLFQVRDELRLFLIAGEIGEKEKAYPLVERFCNRAILKLEEVDFQGLFSKKLDKKTSLEIDRDLEIIFNSCAEVRTCFLKVVFVVFGAAAANSPGILIISSPAIIFLVTAFWFNKVRSFLFGLIKKAMGNLFLTTDPAGC